MNENNLFSCGFLSQKEIIERFVDGMALIDDVFFRAVMRDNPKAAEAIVRVALDMPDVHIESVSIQHEVSFPEKRGVRFDLKARRKDGKLFDIEVQKDGEGDLARRARYYLSALTVDSLKPKQGFEEIPDAYVLFVCKGDPFKAGEAVYRFAMCEETGDSSAVSLLGDGGQIVFFNCAYRGDDAYGKLALDMTKTDFAEIADPVLKETVKSGKIGQRRNELVTGISKEIYDTAKAIGLQEGAAKAREADILALLRDGTLPPERIASILGIPLEDVLALKEREGI